MPVDALVVGYLIAYLANMLPVPGGFGVLEAGLAGMLIAYGAPATQAAAAVVVYHTIRSGSRASAASSATHSSAAESHTRSHTGMLQRERSLPPSHLKRRERAHETTCHRHRGSQSPNAPSHNRQERRSPHPAHQRPPRGHQGPDQCVSNVESETSNRSRGRDRDRCVDLGPKTHDTSPRPDAGAISSAAPAEPEHARGTPTWTIGRVLPRQSARLRASP